MPHGAPTFWSPGFQKYTVYIHMYMYVYNLYSKLAVSRCLAAGHKGRTERIRKHFFEKLVLKKANSDGRPV
jgi:hypothetical protein